MCVSHIGLNWPLVKCCISWITLEVPIMPRVANLCPPIVPDICIQTTEPRKGGKWAKAEHEVIVGQFYVRIYPCYPSLQDKIRGRSPITMGAIHVGHNTSISIQSVNSELLMRQVSDDRVKTHCVHQKQPRHSHITRIDPKAEFDTCHVS